MKTKPITYLILCCLAISIISCENHAINDSNESGPVTVYGKITNPSGSKVCIRYYRKLTGDEIVVDSSLVDKEGNFSMTFTWKNHNSADFIFGTSYGESGVTMFLFPGDSLKITFDAENAEETVKYEGKGAEVNNYFC